MTPALRLACSLLLSLLLWLPTIPTALATSEDPARIALRYLLSLVIARVGVGLVFRLVGGYVVEDGVDEEPDAQGPLGAEPLYGRRREDVFDGSPTEEALLDEALHDAADAAVLTQ